MSSDALSHIDGAAVSELPKGWKHLVEVIDGWIETRPAAQCPVILLRRVPPSDGIPRVTPGELVARYQSRLSLNGASLIPYSMVADAGLTGAEPHVALLRKIAADLDRNMPEGSGPLALPQFDLWSALLDIVLPDGSAHAKRSALGSELYQKLGTRRSWPRKLAESLAGLLPGPAAPFVTGQIEGISQWWFTVLLNRKRNWKWVRELGIVGGRHFLDIAAEMTAEKPARQNIQFVRELLLIALIGDLSKASKPKAWSPWRDRRQWSFVLLLPGIGEPAKPATESAPAVPESPCRGLLDTFNSVLTKGAASPVLVLGARSGPSTSTYVKEIAGGESAGRNLCKLYPGSTPPKSRVWEVALEPDSDIGEAEPWLSVNRRIGPREDSTWDLARPVAPYAALAVVAAAVLGFVIVGRSAPQCWQASNGEMVGVTDGADGCDLATGPYAAELRAVEATMAKNNKEVDRKGIYRTLVFFAPMSATASSGLATPTGIQLFRGALAQQKYLNSTGQKAKVHIRMLLANAGERFVYGWKGLNKDGRSVAEAIIARKDSDKIAAVVGITQSRYASLTAITELNEAHLPVLGIGVTGDAMVGLSTPLENTIDIPGTPSVETPYKYFQLSPPNRRLAKVMAAFAVMRQLCGDLGLWRCLQNRAQ